MAVSTSSEFDGWLSGFLDGLDVDGEVYGGYIGGTLRTLEGAGPDEVEEALSDILTACLEDESSCTAASREIVDKWQLHLSSTASQEKPTDQPTTDDPLKLAPVDTLVLAPHTTIAQNGSDRTAASITGVELTTAEKRQLVAMYGCEEEEEEDEETSTDPGGGKTGGGKAGGTEDKSRAVKEKGKSKGGKEKEGGRGKTSKDVNLFQRNTNASSVAESDKKRREQEKAAHAAKVEKDRKSREEQKQKQQERKEKEKKRTQKGERRRC